MHHAVGMCMVLLTVWNYGGIRMNEITPNKMYLILGILLTVLNITDITEIDYIYRNIITMSRITDMTKMNEIIDMRLILLLAVEESVLF